jgi:DNA replication protein DnaC
MTTLASMITNQTRLYTRDDEPEEAPTCEFCGEKLIANKFFNTLSGRFMQIGWKPCMCEGAKAKRAEDEAREAAERKAEHDAKRAKLLQNAGVGLRYVNAHTTNCAELSDKIQDEKCNLFITGNVGSGKTYLACATLGELVFKTTVKFTYFNTLVNDLMRYHDETAGSLMSACKKCGVLVIDDMGKENMSDFVVSQIFELVNERYANMKPTIVTSNFTVAELEKRLASRGNVDTAKAIVSRLTDNCHILKLQHEDRRKTRTAKD